MTTLPSVAGRLRRASAAHLARVGGCRACRRPPWTIQIRSLADLRADAVAARASRSLSVPSQSRFNEIGVQQVSSHIFRQIFPDGCTPPPADLVQLCKDHLRRHDLLGKNTDDSNPIAFNLPRLHGRTLDEHFHRLGLDCAEPFLTYAKQFVRSSLPPRPRKWVRRSGWTKYYPDGRTESIEAPDEKMLCFDTESLWKESRFAIMACAASPTAWYAWLSPWLLDESTNDRQLIPLGDPSTDRIIVGHHIGYDRARVLEEYNITQSRNAFIDTMSLHVAVNGMCSQQKPTWMRHKKNRELRERVATETPDHQLAELLSNRNMHEEEELWVERSSVNSLRDVAKFHLNVSMDKSARDDFAELDRHGVLEKLNVLMDYCAADVSITHRVYQIVFPNFLNVCPHPVSFAALRHLSSVILPVDKSWDAYISNAEATYTHLSNAIQERLVGLAEKALEFKDQPERWMADPWMRQLDWSGQEIRMVKGKRKSDPPRPAASQKKPGMPQWYKDLFPKKDAPLHITVRSRIAPLLLRMAWEGNPLVWSDKHGWVFRVARAQSDQYTGKQMVECDFDESDAVLRADYEHAYFKLPHKDGPSARCASPLAKGYLNYFENGTLSSEYAYAKEALEMNASCSYWISARDRIASQMVVYDEDLPLERRARGGQSRRTDQTTDASALVSMAMADATKGLGFILPQVIPMGTITRRAVEKTWLTASNAKKNRVGSELKAMVRAPPGYCFVGADVDSQELWIASLVGDATFNIHGGNAVGFMTLEGNKALGTDLHSRTAGILGISRNDAKVFNYGRIYGAGLKFAATLLRQFNPKLSERQTMEVASKLYSRTKGTKTNRKLIYKRPFWRGGTESFVFNKLEEFAEQERPRTPVLGAGITEALMSRFIGKGGYLTSRINWAIQSSGVDYLHLLIVSMDYLIRRFRLEARLAITVHDEIRYLVKREDRYRAAMALQVANVWTRAMFAQQMGISDLPQSCAYFSAVDIDHVLRKEVDMECVTPSHPMPIPPGESLDIESLLDKGDEALLDPSTEPEARFAPRLESFDYAPRTPVMRLMQEESTDSLTFIRAQVCDSDEELREIIREVKKEGATTKTGGKERLSGNAAMRGVLPYRTRAKPVAVEEPMSVAEAMKELDGGPAGWSWARSSAKGTRPSSTSSTI